MTAIAVIELGAPPHLPPERLEMTDNAEMDNVLAGLRVLIVEDEGAIAMLLEDMLFDFGCEIAGSVPRLAKALALLDETEVDLAIIDFNIAGETAEPLAAELVKRAIPFIFSTGYGGIGISAEFAAAPVLAKPFTQRDLRLCLEQAAASR